MIRIWVGESHPSFPSQDVRKDKYLNTVFDKLLDRLDDRFWELKEAAKWSLDVNERKKSIRLLADYYGPQAVQSITEIRDVAAYDEIKRACIEAIRAVSSHKTARKTKRSSAIKSKKKNNTRKKK